MCLKMGRSGFKNHGRVYDEEISYKYFSKYVVNNIVDHFLFLHTYSNYQKLFLIEI
jgi:hypothetical protein